MYLPGPRFSLPIFSFNFAQLPRSCRFSLFDWFYNSHSLAGLFIVCLYLWLCGPYVWWHRYVGFPGGVTGNYSPSKWTWVFWKWFVFLSNSMEGVHVCATYVSSHVCVCVEVDIAHVCTHMWRPTENSAVSTDYSLAGLLLLLAQLTSFYRKRKSNGFWLFLLCTRWSLHGKLIVFACIFPHYSLSMGNLKKKL